MPWEQVSEETVKSELVDMALGLVYWEIYLKRGPGNPWVGR
jgi:hypothetical protein